MNKIFGEIIQNSDIGYACHKIIFDINNEISDLQFIEVNNSFKKHTGIKTGNISKIILENFFSEIIGEEFDMLGFYKRISKNGKGENYEKYLEEMDKYFQYTIYNYKKNYIIIICRDITETKKLKEMQNILRQTIDSLPSRLFWKDKNFKYLGGNKTFFEYTGCNIEEIRGKDDYQINWKGASSPNLYRKEDEYVIKTGRPLLNYKEEVINANEERHWIKTTKIPIYDTENNISGLLGRFDDIIEDKKIESESRNNWFKIEQLMRISRSIIWEVDKNGKYTYISSEAEHLFGYSFDEIVNKKYIYETIEKNLQEEYKEYILTIINKKEILSNFESKLKTKNNEDVWVLTNGFPVMDNKNELVSYRGISTDVTCLKKIEEEIRYLSFRDQLTGLYNRRFFDEELERLDTERNLPLSLIMIDIDGLKLINDALGHKIGDSLIKKVANIIKRESRSDDIISRIGGDEFVILFPKTSIEEAKILMDRINREIRKESMGAINISISYGCESKDNINENIEEVLKKADIKMYNHKNRRKENIRKQNIENILEKMFQESKEEKNHSKGVSELAVEIGKALELTEIEIEKLELIGKFHDIGKIIISKEIINKKDQLNYEEWKEVKRHSELGYIILNSSDQYNFIAKDVLHHHERYDGKGYPEGLKGEEIPLNSRIIALANAYDTMKRDRPYREALSREEAENIVLEESGKQFDPKIVKVFLESRIIENYKIR